MQPSHHTQRGSVAFGDGKLASHPMTSPSPTVAHSFTTRGSAFNAHEYEPEQKVTIPTANDSMTGFGSPSSSLTDVKSAPYTQQQHGGLSQDYSSTVPLMQQMPFQTSKQTGQTSTGAPYTARSSSAAPHAQYGPPGVPSNLHSGPTTSPHAQYGHHAAPQQAAPMLGPSGHYGTHGVPQHPPSNAGHYGTHGVPQHPPSNAGHYGTHGVPQHPPASTGPHGQYGPQGVPQHPAPTPPVFPQPTAMPDPGFVSHILHNKGKVAMYAGLGALACGAYAMISNYVGSRSILYELPYKSQAMAIDKYMSGLLNELATFRSYNEPAYKNVQNTVDRLFQHESAILDYGPTDGDRSVVRMFLDDIDTGLVELRLAIRKPEMHLACNRVVERIQYQLSLHHRNILMLTAPLKNSLPRSFPSEAPVSAS